MRYKDILNEKKEKKWVAGVDTDYSTPEGTFTKSAEEIANQLLKDASSPGQAMRRISFYINRAGSNLKNKVEIEKAKAIIKQKAEKELD